MLISRKRSKAPEQRQQKTPDSPPSPARSTKGTPLFLRLGCTTCGKDNLPITLPGNTRVGPTNDGAEREAEAVSRRISGMSRGPQSQEAAAQTSPTDIRGGHALPEDMRRYMEPRFGTDFSQVVVHTGAEAEESTRRLGARAMTYANHIWIGRDESEHDKELMAHELTHVVQQIQSSQPLLQRAEKTFGDYFSDCMESMGIPVPSSLFTSIATAKATIAAIAGAVAKFGAEATIGEIALTGLGAGVSTAVVEWMIALGALSASFLVGAMIGCLASATGEWMSGGYSLGDVMYDVFGPAPDWML